jgi:hypothetical protein|tara:strand:- start:1841 stop:2815 length:975 start_codon:yes stop_codon:yes gene_type:complete
MKMIIRMFCRLLLAQLALCNLSLGDDGSFHFCALGDMPYYLPADYERFDNVIDVVNAENPAFTVHVGDTKSGSSLCSDESYQRTLKSFSRFEHPLIYTPGDNEWTDCNRAAAGDWDAVERLSLVRKLFFKDSNTLGGGDAFKLTVQSSDPQFATFVENRMWSKGHVVFATVHIVGSKNNRQENIPGAVEEFLVRDEANEAWLDTVFNRASSTNAPALALFIHANPFRDLKDERDPNAGFARFLEQLQKRTIAFEKPVLLVHGDTHYFRIDKPMMHEGTKRDSVENFTRLEVFGATNMHALRIDVDPSSPQVFSANQVIVKANRK